MTEKTLPENIQIGIENRIKAISTLATGPGRFFMQTKAIAYFEALRDAEVISNAYWAQLDKTVRDTMPTDAAQAYDQYCASSELFLLNLGSSQAITPLNVAARFAEDAGSLLGLFQAASGVNLTVQQNDLARSVGLSVAAEQVPNVRLLADAWAKEPSLAAFAAAVRWNMIPR